MSEQRLIDANALLMHECEADKMGAMLVVGKGYILDAPTVPAEVVVHCRDCRFRQIVEDGTYGTFYACGYNDEENSGLGGFVQSNDYCSYGEHRESEAGK